MASSRNDSSTSLKQQHDLADTASSPDAKKPRLREPKVNWTAEEDAQLAAGVEKYGTDTKAWNQIADTFNGTRDVKRCRERWQEYIDPSLSHAAFTDAEDTAILACQRHFGNQWKMIAEVMSKEHEHRSATAIKSRWHQLQKREQRMNKYAERMKAVRKQCGMHETRKDTSTKSTIYHYSGNDVKEVNGSDESVKIRQDAAVMMHQGQLNANNNDPPSIGSTHERSTYNCPVQNTDAVGVESPATQANAAMQLLCDVATSCSQLQPTSTPLNFSDISATMSDTHVINNCITAHIPSPRPLTTPMMQFTAAYERHMHATHPEQRMQYPIMGYSAPYFPADVPAPPTVWQYPPVYGNQYYEYNTMQHPLPPPAPQYLPHPVPFMQYPLQQAYYNNDEDEEDDFLVHRYFQEYSGGDT